MPHYYLKCEACEVVTEDYHNITAEHPPCSSCGGKNNTYLPQGTTLYPSMSNDGKALVEERRTMRQLNRR